MTHQIGEGTVIPITSDADIDLTGLSACTIKVIKTASDTNTKLDSNPQIIDVTKAPTPNLTVTQAETFSGTGIVETTTAHEYSANGTDGWTDCGGALTGLMQNTTRYIRVKATGTVLASDNQEVTINQFTGSQEDTPNAAFEATGPDCGTLTNVTGGMKYSLDGGTTWIDITGTSAAIASGVTTSNGIKVYQPGNGTTTADSDAQSITVSRAATPNLTATQPSTIGGKGSITTTTDYQQSTNGTAWTDCTGPWENLSAGTYYVRVKASGATLASDAQTITITEYTPGKETTPSASFTATGPDSGTLTNVTSGMKYSLDGGTAWIDISGTSVAIASGVTTVNGIKVYQPGNGTTTADSDAQSITVSKGEKPTAPTATNCTTSSNNDGKITGVTIAMEYKKPDAADWTGGTGSDITGLVPGIYYVRLKAMGASLASDHQELVIAAYTAPEQVAAPAFSPAAGNYTTAQAVTISCATDNAAIYYTINGDTPTADSAKYTEPIVMDRDTTIKAIAVKDGMADSAISEAVYTIVTPEAYTVKVTNNGNGTGSASPASGVTGTAVMLTASPAAGFQFKEWQVISGGATVKDNQFAIGTENVEIRAVFEAISEKKYYTIAGEGQVHMEYSGQDASFTVKSTKDDENTINNFQKAFVDNKELRIGIDCDIHAGSLMLTLKAAYLDTLAVGEHTLTVLFTDGRVDSRFIVSHAADPTNFDDVAVPSDSFTFKVVWQGGSDKNVNFTLYRKDGMVYHHGFDKKALGSGEWRYSAWFSAPAACYVIETPMEGYQILYENVGVYEQVTDRCCDGGTIIIHKVPKTGDTANLALWMSMVVVGAMILCGVTIFDRRGKKRVKKLTKQDNG